MTPRKPVRVRKARHSGTCPRCRRRVLVGQLIASVDGGPFMCAAHVTKEDTMTAVTAEPDTTPLEILKAGACSPSCLLSGASGRCNCRCRGAYHGVLLASLTRSQQTAA